MNKSDFINAITEKTDLSKASAAQALDAVLETVTTSLKDGESVAFPGFGTFTVKERAARTGRNPRTGEVIEIAAARVPSFKAGKSLKDAVA